MRVLIVVLEDFPGGDTRVRRQVAALAERGHNVLIMCARAYSLEADYVGAKILRTFTRREKAGSMKRRLFEYLCFTIEAFFRVTILAIRYRPHVVQVANMPDFLVVSALPARILSRSRIVLDLHDLMPELYSVKASAGTLLHSMMRLQEKFGVGLADSVITVNQICCRLLQERHVDAKIVVIPNAPDPKTFPRLLPKELPARPNCFRLGYHGTIAPRFGVSSLIRAISLLVERDVDVSLDVWGGGDMFEAVCDEVKVLGLSDRVKMHGQVKVNVLIDQIPLLDLSVVPYKADPYMEIAYSTKAFELAMMGIPMVIADLAGIREQFNDQAVTYFAAGDARDLADKIQHALFNPEETLSKALEAQNQLAAFDWSQISAHYVDVIARAAEGNYRF